MCHSYYKIDRINKKNVYDKMFNDISDIKMPFKHVLTLPGEFGNELPFLFNKNFVNDKTEFTFIENGNAYKKGDKLWQEHFHEKAMKNYAGNIKNHSFVYKDIINLTKDDFKCSVDFAFYDMFGMLTNGLSEWIKKKSFAIHDFGAHVFWTINLQAYQFKHYNFCDDLSDTKYYNEGAPEYYPDDSINGKPYLADDVLNGNYNRIINFFRFGCGGRNFITKKAILYRESNETMMLLHTIVN